MKISYKRAHDLLVNAEIIRLIDDDGDERDAQVDIYSDTKELCISRTDEHGYGRGFDFGPDGNKTVNKIGNKLSFKGIVKETDEEEATVLFDLYLYKVVPIK